MSRAKDEIEKRNKVQEYNSVVVNLLSDNISYLPHTSFRLKIACNLPTLLSLLIE